MRKSEKGFTLIELMIVIAIIAIIAAIAIPGLLQSQRASNERNASSSLKTLATAEADFRANDRDANRVQDFWSQSVGGLYGLIPVATSDMIKLIEISVGAADFNAATSGMTAGTPGTAAGNTNTVVPPTTYAVSAPKAGYWYKAMTLDEDGGNYTTDTSGVTTTDGSGSNVTPGRNHTRFGFLAFPDSYSSGRSMFFINEGNTVFKRPVIANVKPTGSTPNSTVLNTSGYAGAGTNAAERWPNDTNLKALYSKID